MEYREKKSEWQQQVEERRRKVVFPQSSKEETDSCVNFKERPTPFVGKMFFAFFAAVVLIFFLFLAYRLHREGALLSAVIVLGVIGVFFLGPLFGLLAWSTHRSMKKIQELKRSRRISPRQY